MPDLQRANLLIQVNATAPADLGPFVAAFAQLCLAPLVASIEAEWEGVLPPGQHLQLDMSGLVRGSFSAAVGALAVGKQAGFLSANDCRDMLGLAAHPDGDDLGSGPPPSYPADAAGVPSLAPKPGPTDDGLPNVGTHEGEGN